MRTCTLGILSDIHYAGAAEQARGHDYELRDIPNPAVRKLAHLYRHYLWLREPLRKNHLLDQFLERGADFDYVIANGDYSCNTAFVGLSDDAACQSVLRMPGQDSASDSAPTCALNYGDHELGKIPMFGGKAAACAWPVGAARRRRWDCSPSGGSKSAVTSCIGFVSSLVALPVFEADMLPAERPEWERLRAEHLAEIRRAFDALQPGQRVLLFCHDPTALPFLWREESVRAKLPQIEQTTIGHLHSNLVLWKSRLLAGMPPIRFLGHTVKRLSTALSEARYWRPFHVRLCPALAGIELLKDGGYCTLELDPEARQPARFRFHPIHRA